MMEQVQGNCCPQGEDRKYSLKELEEDWEFKVVQAYTGTFRNPNLLQRLIDEEACVGWEMLEVLDDSMVRFKRRRSDRAQNASLPPGVNPYRTTFRTLSPAMTVAWLILGGALLGLLACTIMYVMSGA
ncbi:MAG: hypothetical protein JXB30_20220 [Anaerolineae bacterium]|nr:hypothetical protein [Anaerolineae bacterium]